MPDSDGPPAGCPVCETAAGTEPTCAACGWTMRAPLRLGPVTPALRQEFDAGLDQARRRLDARTAARLSADRDDYGDLIRGGRPSDAEWATAREAAAAAAAGAVTGEQLRSRVEALLAGLQPGDGPVIVTIGPEGVAVGRVRLDDFGSPALTPEASRADWPSLLPALPAGRRQRLFRLAGPVSDRGEAQLLAAISQVTAGLSGPGGLVICRPAGWELLERAAQLARDRLPGALLVRATAETGETALDVLLGTLIREAPLRLAYGLVVAVVHPDTGSVRAALHPLFAPGDRPGTEAQLSLPRSTGQSEVTVALVPGRDVRRAPLLVQVAALPPGPRYRFRAVLDGPGQVRILDPAGTRPTAESWAQTLADLPERVDARPRPLDLVCAIELAGTPQVVRSRINLVRDLLDLLTSGDLASGPLRVSVLGCEDHVFGRDSERRRVVRGAPLATVTEARVALRSFRASPVRYPDAAPLEDMLAEAAVQLSGSRRDGRAARVLTVAARLPHPYPLGNSRRHPCPRKYQWKVQVRRLTQTCGASCVVVADTLPRRPDTRAMWRALGSTAQREIGAVCAQQLGEDLGILAPASQRLPIPLADPLQE
jgi:hypothetical protein